MYTPLQETFSHYKITNNVTNYISTIIQNIDIINTINIYSGNYEETNKLMKKATKEKNTKTKDDQNVFPHKFGVYIHMTQILLWGEYSCYWRGVILVQHGFFCLKNGKSYDK